MSMQLLIQLTLLVLISPLSVPAQSPKVDNDDTSTPIAQSKLADSSATRPLKQPSWSPSRLKTPKTVIDDVDEDTLHGLLDEHEHVAIFLHAGIDALTEDILLEIEQMDTASLDLEIVRMENQKLAEDYGIDSTSLPALVFLQDGIPEKFSGDLKSSSSVLNWLTNEVKADEIEVIEFDLLKKIVNNGNSIGIIFSSEIKHGVDGIKDIHTLCKRLDVPLIHIVGEKGPRLLGIDTLPGLVYYENTIPSVFEGNLDDTDNVLDWIMEQRTADTIEEVTEEILKSLVSQIEYVGVLFTGPCNEAAKNTECEEILEELELIDDDIDEYGITFVTTEDIKYAGNILKIRAFPALGLFRNGNFLLYEGDLHDAESTFSWMVDEDTIEIPGVIEKVGEKMLGKILEDEKDVLCFFYETKNIKTLSSTMKALEKIDDQLDAKDIEFVKCSDNGIKKEYALDNIPSLVYFENKIPIEYDGNLNDETEILSWILEELENESIRTVDEDTLQKLIDTSNDIVAVFYDRKKKKQNKFIEQLDTIDDDAEKLEIFMVKVDDPLTAKHYGLYALPAVIHFKNGIPNIYEGAQSPRVIFNWLEDQKTSSSIEEVNAVLLDKLIKEEEYVAVIFLSECIEEEKLKCQEIIENLEEIDNELDDIDILLVKIDEPQYAKNLKIKTFPTIGLFRNTELALYDGKIDNAMALLKWMTDLDNLKVEGKIEEVGIPLLELIIEKEKDVFALLYEEGDRRAQKIINELEGIDDNLENDKIILVKCSDTGADDYFGIGYLPRLVYFENGLPVMFPGAEVNQAEVLNWISMELEQNTLKLVSRAIAETLIKKKEHIGLFFINDEESKGHSVIKDLESDMFTIEEEELLLVLIDDPEFAEELGLELPSLIHFTNTIPNVYREDITSKTEMLKWLIDKKDEDVIEKVTKQILEELIEEQEYLLVLYTGGVVRSDDVYESIMDFLEELDDELDGRGISFVQTDDEESPLINHQITKFPALVLFRNEHALKFEDNIENKEEVLNWINDVNNLKVTGVMEEVNELLLAYLYETEDKLVVFFYEKGDRDADELIEGFEIIDDDLERKSFTLVKTSDSGVELQYGILGLPKVVFFQNGIPIICEIDLMSEKEILAWINKQSATNSIHKVSDVVLDGLIRKFDHIAVLFYSHKNKTVVNTLQSLADGCDDNDIAFVRIEDKEEAMKYGITDIPALMFFNQQVPSIYTGDLSNSGDVFDWITKNQASSVVEEVTDEILEELVEKHEYVAVFFRGLCDEETDDCDGVLAKLENIDDELDEIGILLVTTDDKGMSRKNGLIELPAFGIFRNGGFLAYGSNVQTATEKQLKDWVTSENTLKIIGVIDEVNLKMLNNILEEESDCFVFFYGEHDPDAHSLLAELEDIDEKLDKRDLHMVKISDSGAAEEYGITDIPCLVYFENGVPELFNGELKNDNQVMKWMLDELKQEEIKRVTIPMLNKLIDRGHNLAVVFLDETTDNDDQIMAELEHIDDDCRKYDIDFVAAEDNEEAESYGVEVLPTLIYFENGIPSLYDGGELTSEEEVLEWLVLQKTSDTIEQVTDKILVKLIESEEYLAVFFSGRCGPGDICFEMLENLENIDTSLSDYGIMLVSTEDKDLARTHGVNFYPALGLFRNGDFVKFSGDIMDEFEVLEWLTARETLEIPGVIEAVNSEMLAALLEEESDLIVFMYRDNNRLDEAILYTMSELDAALDEKDIKMVSIAERGIEKEYGLYGLPLLVHFNGNIPVVYKGDLGDEVEFLKFVEDSIDSNDIEEVNGDILDSLTSRLPNIAAVFFDNDDQKNVEIIAAMEEIDDDCDNYGIPLVKIEDITKAKEDLGLDSLPAIIYWKNEVPSMFVGDISDTHEVLEWMKSRKSGDTIELVTEEILEDMVDNFDYVLSYFQPYCREGDDFCEENKASILEGLEYIDDDIDDLGISLVTTRDTKYARQLGIKKLPCLGLFRNGDLKLFEGDLNSEMAILNWLSEIDTLEIVGVIEKVNSDMLRNIISLEDDVLVFIYDEDDRNCEDYLFELETIDDNLEVEDVEFVKCSDTNVEREYGLTQVPALVFFENGVPEVYMGDLRNDDEMLTWVTKRLTNTELEEVSPGVLNYLMDQSDFLAVLYYSKETRRDSSIISKLEEIDDDCKLNDIKFVKVGDEREMAELGVDDSPLLVYYESGIPNLYSGSLVDTTGVMSWLVGQRNGAAIEDVSDSMLRTVIEENEFVAVFFSGSCVDEDEEECEVIRGKLETIDHHLDYYGIVFVATHEKEVARENKVKRFPTVGIFRNGEFLKFDGNLHEEVAVLGWLICKETLDMPKQIEKINEVMLAKKITLEFSLFVFFYDDEDIFAQRLLAELEQLDDVLDAKGVYFAKISDAGIGDTYSLETLPALVHFLPEQVTVFQGDLRNEETVKSWLDQQCQVADIAEQAD